MSNIIVQHIHSLQNDLHHKSRYHLPYSYQFHPPPIPFFSAAKLLQSCPTLCDPIDSSPPGSPVPGILQARTLEWVAISFSNAWKWKVIVKSLSPVQLLVTPWTAAHQAPPSTGFSRQEYWSGVPLPSPPSFLVTTNLFSVSMRVFFYFVCSFSLDLTFSGSIPILELFLLGPGNMPLVF